MRLNSVNRRKGAALVEYALLIAGVALICAAAVSVFGHKTSDLIGAVAVVVPGAHTDDNNTIQSGHLIETGPVGTNGAIALDLDTIKGNSGKDRLGSNVAGAAGSPNGFDGLIVESN